MGATDPAEVVELEAPPALTPMLAKVAARALPIPGMGGSGSGGGGAQLPDVAVVLRAAAIDPRHVADYAEVCGFRVGDDLPLTYLHMLAFPLSVQLMTRPDFPFGLMGMVHIRNTITRTRPVTLDELVDVTARVVDLRPHPKGQQLDSVAVAEVDGQEVWRSTSTYLKRGGGGAEAGAAAQAGEDIHPADAVDVTELPLTARWRVPGDIGRRYGAVSGDRNPIHLSALTARAFGFPRAIAHGMWTKARALAGLEGQVPDACTVDVAFKTPLLLPGTVEYCTRREGSHRDGGGWSFGVRGRDGRPHLAGVVGPTA